MASAILHIKDSYYFEVPKGLLPRHYASKADFPTLWVQLDPQFQAWEAERLYDEFAKLNPSVGPKSDLLHEYEEWKHDHANEGKPFDKFLEQHEDYRDWFATTAKLSGGAQWEAAKERAGGEEAVAIFKKDPTINWSPETIHAYNKHLSGKILIPQPFGELRNFYEKESGFAISRFMIIEVAIALILWVIFAWLGRQVESGERPRGRLWNLLEVFVVFVRDQVARPAIGSHDGDRFVPLLLTIFFFILGCNLSGMLPWVGAPTGSWGVTFGLACVTFSTVIVCGMQKFGFVGFFLNQIPGMDLPLPIAIVLKPMILAIELLGLLIKHLVLSIRLLANMVAGHIVLLAIMMMAFSLEGAASEYWGVVAPISVIGATLISCLELFVAFLQAYIFTFLSALFIGAAIHHH
ncbi:MAG: F0F1 ATP synthase subunit A [Planctomycetaceae bacterium]|nr:F0F1 ATP synthase subunit A [Planctomycetaceae bacterium]MCB9941047.1 F0F1 ATP synthase subunit A [Planctomycetaceae bacterium]